MDTSEGIKFRFQPQSSKSKKVLGPLESVIMDVAWEQGPTTVSAVHKALRSKKDIAYTTVMTTMSRMAKKRLLTQDKSATSYVYAPALNKEDFESYVVKSVIRGLFDDYGDSVVDYFAECVGERGDDTKKRLQDAV
jgi:predicted transcriptional regulator